MRRDKRYRFPVFPSFCTWPAQLDLGAKTNHRGVEKLDRRTASQQHVSPTASTEQNKKFSRQSYSGPIPQLPRNCHTVTSLRPCPSTAGGSLPLTPFIVVFLMLSCFRGPAPLPFPFLCYAIMLPLVAALCNAWSISHSHVTKKSQSTVWAAQVSVHYVQSKDRQTSVFKGW